MRGALIDTLVSLAEHDPRLFFMTADLGFSVVEKFADKFPKQFVNVGVAEANMLSMAAGMAREGCIPYVYSIATFTAMRGYEQLRNGAVIHNLPVRVIGIGGGFAYGHAGITHHCLEDYAIMRVQPGLRVVAPADPAQARNALVANHTHPGPVYFRIGKGGNPEVPGLAGSYRPEGVELLGDGGDFLIITTGTMATEAIAAREELARQGRHGTVCVAATLQPAPRAELDALRGRYKCVLSLEEHYLNGGLGSMVAEWLCESGWGVPFQRLGVRDIPLGTLGGHAFMLDKAGISRRHVVDAVLGVAP